MTAVASTFAGARCFGDVDGRTHGPGDCRNPGGSMLQAIRVLPLVTSPACDKPSPSEQGQLTMTSPSRMVNDTDGVALPTRPAEMIRLARRVMSRNVHLGRPPLNDKAARWSAIAPVGSDVGDLVDLALAAASGASDLSLDTVAKRARRPEEAEWVRQWPGEHYRLLAALVEVLQPRAVVEVGTFTGLSALAILSTLPTAARLTTFDVVPWREIPATALRADDFGTNFEQRLADLSHPEVFAAHLDLFESADLVFVDGPKDRRFEVQFLPQLFTAMAGRGGTVVLDDIRVIEMLDVWERISSRKLDVTSFGHWSGTGLVAP